MVIEAVNGDPEAITDGYAPAGVFGPEPVQLCIANHVGYSSDVAFQVNLGGALGDLNWLDSGDPAMISFQTPVDQFAPYTTGVLVVPTTGENVVEVSGAYDIHAEINAQADPNNNAAYQALGLSDVFSPKLWPTATWVGMVCTPSRTTTWVVLQHNPSMARLGSGGMSRTPNLWMPQTAPPSPRLS